MIQYKTLNVKLSNSYLNKLLLEIKNGIELTLNLSSNVISGSNKELNFPHKLLSTDTQVLSLRQVFVNNSSASIKLSKLSYLKWCNQEES